MYPKTTRWGCFRIVLLKNKPTNSVIFVSFFQKTKKLPKFLIT